MALSIKTHGGCHIHTITKSKKKEKTIQNQTKYMYMTQIFEIINRALGCFVGDPRPHTF